MSEYEEDVELRKGGSEERDEVLLATEEVGEEGEEEGEADGERVEVGAGVGEELAGAGDPGTALLVWPPPLLPVP